MYDWNQQQRILACILNSAKKNPWTGGFLHSDHKSWQDWFEPLKELCKEIWGPLLRDEGNSCEFGQCWPTVVFLGVPKHRGSESNHKVFCIAHCALNQSVTAITHHLQQQLKCCDCGYQAEHSNEPCPFFSTTLPSPWWNAKTNLRQSNLIDQIHSTVIVFVSAFCWV